MEGIGRIGRNWKDDQVTIDSVHFLEEGFIRLGIARSIYLNWFSLVHFLEDGQVTIDGWMDLIN